MSNADTLREGYETFGSGDLDGATADFADDTMLSDSESKTKETGEEVKLPWVDVWCLRHEQVVEVLALTDTALAADAVGRL